MAYNLLATGTVTEMYFAARTVLSSIGYHSMTYHDRRASNYQSVL